ncbi:MAG: SurA N-terminal domain-containing protein [Boseongicola sp.]|nr:SurA N-terminal domain-containing protein [Boseongicola sp.]NNJ67187.1 peptidylprolyl isomerase [Boseongicola sp.]
MAKKKASNVFVWIIMVLLIAGLAGFGATNFGGSVRNVATVGDTDVSAETFARTLQAQLRSYQQVTGQALTVQQAREFGFDRAALGQVVRDAALLNATAEAGISVGDENVAREVASSSAFQGLSGEFDRETYEFALRQNGVSVREYETEIRDGISSGLLRTAVQSGVRTPDIFTDTLFNYAREARDITWARLTRDDLEEPLAEPSDAELRAFHTENPAPFTQGETRVINYAWLTPDMIVDNIEVDDAQVRALYDGRLSFYVRPERRIIERLVFATEAEAVAAKARIDAEDATFEDLVNERGLTLDDVDLGDVEIDELGDAGAALFALEEPGVAGPLPSSLGPALYRMNAILSAQETTFDEAREELAAEAAADRARRIILEGQAQVEDLIAGGATPAQLAERTDMQAGTINWREDVTDGIAAYDAFRLAAASAEVGAFAEVGELDDGGIFVLSLEEILPPELLPFESLRGEVVEAWEAAETEAALSAQAEAYAERLRGGAEMAGLGLRLETDRGLERNGFVDGTPPGFTDQVFDMDAGEVRVLTEAGEAWLVRLDAIAAPDPNTPEAQLVIAQFGQETARELSESLLAAFTQAVLSETEVSINQPGIDAVTASAP